MGTRLGDYATWCQSSRSIDLALLQACFSATKQKLGGKLVADLLRTLFAVEFVAYVKAHPHKHLAPYKLQGVSWLRLIEARSRQCRGMLQKSGNVLYVNFRMPVISNNKQ